MVEDSAEETCAEEEEEAAMYMETLRELRMRRRVECHALFIDINVRISRSEHMFLDLQKNKNKRTNQINTILDIVKIILILLV